MEHRKESCPISSSVPCFIPGCRREKHDENLTYYPFPSSTVLRTEWIKALRKYKYKDPVNKKRKKKQKTSARHRLCCVQGCFGSHQDAGLSFHEVPALARVAEKWFQFLQNQSENIGIEWRPIGETSKICSQHFVPSDFVESSNGNLHRLKRGRLKRDAVPSVMPPPPFYDILEHLEHNSGSTYYCRKPIYICSKHFLPSDFNMDSNNQRALSDHAIPSLFPDQEESVQDITIISDLPSSTETDLLRHSPKKQKVQHHGLKDTMTIFPEEDDQLEFPKRRAAKCYPGKDVSRYSKSSQKNKKSKSVHQVFPELCDNTYDDEELQYFSTDAEEEQIEYFDSDESEPVGPSDFVDSSLVPFFVVSTSTQTQPIQSTSVAVQVNTDTSIGVQRQIISLKSKNAALSEYSKKLAKELEDEKNKNLLLLKTVEKLKAKNSNMFKINK